MHPKELQAKKLSVAKNQLEMVVNNEKLHPQMIANPDTHLRQ